MIVAKTSGVTWIVMSPSVGVKWVEDAGVFFSGSEVSEE
jgi:L-lactate permease